MRYLGNKTRIIDYIDDLVTSKHLEGGVFADIFSGTGTVGDRFKDRFEIISNDIMEYAAVFSNAKVSNADIPKFDKFIEYYGLDPFDYWNSYKYDSTSSGFVTSNYSPKGNRQFFQEKNAIKIDTIRQQIEVDYKAGRLAENEKVFILASLLESTMGVSNTSGTYEAFFNDWEARSYKDFVLVPLSLEKRKLYSKNNKVFNQDSNELVRNISGNVVYIDTPYTVTQYASAYHVLETIAKDDNPSIHGKTGRRDAPQMSSYSRKNAAKTAFEDLLRQLRFNHVIISYSNQGLIPLDDFIDLIKKFAINNYVEVKDISFREYKNLNASQKGNGEKLKEVLIYFEKDFEIVKSPLNYAGSKDMIMDKITASLPKHISNFVDTTGGAFNVGGNVVAMDKVYYNEKNKVVFNLVTKLLSTQPKKILNMVNQIINNYSLSKSNKEAYLVLRNNYNGTDKASRDDFQLYVLTLFGFQHMIRFNSSGDFNIPVGNSGLTEDVVSRINNYRTKSQVGELTNLSFEMIDYDSFDEDTVFYFDPPYIITSAAYNDGNRNGIEWTEQDEIRLLSELDHINKNGQKFLLSNVIKHNGKENELLIDWIQRNGYKEVTIGTGGRRYPRTEVLIMNY